MSDLGNKKIFSKNLKYYMNENNIDRTVLSEKLNIAYTTVNDWYNGITYPRIDKIELIANLFNIKKSDLIEDKRNFDPYDLDEATIKIPVLGVIPAGTPMEAIEDILDYIEIPKDWLRGGKEFFALKLKGDSMFPKYNDGDIVIFKKTPDCNSGDEVCVLVNGFDATFKRLLKHDSGITLQPLNTAYEIKLYSNDDVKNLPIRVLGVAVEMRRKI